MDAEKKTRLEAKGFKVGSAAHVLGMTPEEEKVAQVKAALREAFRAARKKRGLTQTEVASRLGTKKEAVARMESSGSAVTIDNLMRALLVVGVSLAEVAFTISNVELEPAAAKRQGARDSIRLKVEHSNGTASEIAGSVVRGTRVMDLTDIDVLPTPAATVKARAVAETASRLKSAPTAGRDIRKTPKSPRTVI